MIGDFGVPIAIFFMIAVDISIEDAYTQVSALQAFRSRRITLKRFIIKYCHFIALVCSSCLTEITIIFTCSFHSCGDENTSYLTYEIKVCHVVTTTTKLYKQYAFDSTYPRV